jgi:hypothetical protein
MFTSAVLCRGVWVSVVRLNVLVVDLCGARPQGWRVLYPFLYQLKGKSFASFKKNHIHINENKQNRYKKYLQPEF